MFIMKIQNMNDLLTLQIQTLYNVENQLIEAIPQLAEVASSQKLKNALLEHLEVTKGQAKRLEKIGKELDITLTGVTDQGMMYILKSGQIIVQ